jgi:hypothetical protein
MELQDGVELNLLAITHCGATLPGAGDGCSLLTNFVRIEGFHVMDQRRPAPMMKVIAPIKIQLEGHFGILSPGLSRCSRWISNGPNSVKKQSNAFSSAR